MGLNNVSISGGSGRRSCLHRTCKDTKLLSCKWLSIGLKNLIVKIFV